MIQYWIVITLQNKPRTAQRNQCSSMLLIVDRCTFELVTFWSHFEIENPEGANADLWSQFFEDFALGFKAFFAPCIRWPSSESR